MRFRFTVLSLLSVLSATLLAGCFGKVLDFRNAEISNGKVYQNGANEPFSGKVTNIPFSTLPKTPVTTVIRMASDLHGDAVRIYLGGVMIGAICDTEFDKGVPDGKTVCTLSGLDWPVVTMRYEKGSLEGAVKVAGVVKGVTLVEAAYKGNALEGELIINHAETGKLVGRSHWRAGKPHGSEEVYSLTTRELVRKVTYVDGLIEGDVLKYSPDGKQLISKIPYVAGQRHGVEEEYRPEGQLIRKTPYVAGQPHGVEETYSPGGQLIRRGRYVEGREDGLFEEWNEQGQLVRTRQWTNGRPGEVNQSPSQQASAAPLSSAALDDCVDGWTAAFRRENGQDAMVKYDQLEEWKDWCQQGKIAR